jgi:hypothetical protein
MVIECVRNSVGGLKSRPLVFGGAACSHEAIYRLQRTKKYSVFLAMDEKGYVLPAASMATVLLESGLIFRRGDYFSTVRRYSASRLSE